MTNLENGPPLKGVTSNPGAEATDHPAMNDKELKTKINFWNKKNGMEWQSVEEGEETLGKKR